MLKLSRWNKVEIADEPFMLIPAQPMPAQRTTHLSAFACICCLSLFILRGSICSADPAATNSISQPSAFPITSGTAGPIILPQNWLVDGNLDLRYRQASSGRTDNSYVNDSELDIGHPLVFKGLQQGNVYAQILSENVADVSGAPGRGSGVRLGEAYVTYRLPIQTDTGSTAYLKLGQFVLPVGLLPVYDSHLHVLQTLAPLGIGERTDFGAGIEGRFNGVIDYRFALTTGQGPGHSDFSKDRLVTFRLGRLIATPYGVFNIGGSLLSGRLPVTEVDPVSGFAPILPPSGQVIAPDGYVDKTRIVGDAQWTFKGLTARGEAMSGSDKSVQVQGFFLEGDYRFAQGLSAVISRTYWDYGKGQSTSGDNAIGLDVAYGNNTVTRFLYEERRDVPLTDPGVLGPLASTHLRHIFTVQALVRF